MKTQHHQKIKAAFVESGWRHGDQVPNNDFGDLLGSPSSDFTVCLRELERLPASELQERINQLFEQEGAHGVKPVSAAQKKLISLKETTKDLNWKARQVASEALLQIVDLPVEERADHAIKSASLLKGKLAMIELFETNLSEEIGELERGRYPTNES